MLPQEVQTSCASTSSNCFYLPAQGPKDYRSTPKPAGATARRARWNAVLSSDYRDRYGPRAVEAGEKIAFVDGTLMM
jgi:hypothetical protein